MTSEMIPNAGRMRMYTSGWPKIQNRCCHRSGSAPASTLKKLAPYSRSNMSRNSATVMTGMAKSSRNCATSDIHTKIGMRMRVMPGARMLRHVTIRLMAPSREAMPAICRPRLQKSMPCPGEYVSPEFGCVARPAGVGDLTEQDPGVDEQPAGQEDPVAEGVHPGEGDVAGADHQRDQVVRERRQHRHDDEEHHRGAVHGEGLVVGLLREHLAVRLDQLRPDDQRLEAADGEERHRRRAVHDADLLVVDRRQPRPPPRRAPRAGERAEGLVLRGVDARGELERA
jgi:hypothetical protein